MNRRFKDYFTERFAAYGPTALGVDWHDENSLNLHYDKMLAVIRPGGDSVITLLDIGCGYGGLLDRAKKRQINIMYTGIDLVESMIERGKDRHPEARFIAGDAFALTDERRYDYVVANGVLTAKLDASIPEFSAFSRRIVRKMFELANRGIAFNMMTSYVNFFAPNLYYQNPSEIMSFCSCELSPKWIVDHSYEYYDFTMYVYK